MDSGYVQTVEKAMKTVTEKANHDVVDIVT
jgi:hypothetical protein